ncbi:endolytic transglycosylase MltG [Patescibacteria group bacterium]|nr:MAG: endolytic transglycosylase MltG [Patescibacteria group bacterium]
MRRFLSLVQRAGLRWNVFQKHERITALAFSLLVAVSLANAVLWSAPRRFAPLSLVRVPSGATLSEAAFILNGHAVIRSVFWLKASAYLLGGVRSIQAGDYYFEKPISVFGVAYRLTHARYGLKPIRITIPEGLNVFQIAELLSPKLPFFDGKSFVGDAPEGYLFPDTYFFLPNADEDHVVLQVKGNFDIQIKDLLDEIATSGRKLEDVIVMASLIEEETKTARDRRIVSGILWKRLEKKIPLQVDATFAYVNGKNTYTLTRDDLDIDSPYNSYKYAGLPPTPIANPGIDSIRAAIAPEKTDYLYFLSDKRGNIYYAKDFEEHQKNRELYLRK